MTATEVARLGSRWTNNGAAGKDGMTMDHFETDSLALMPGQHVRATVLSHYPWGVIVQTAGDEQIDASVDLIEHFSRTATTDEELLALFPDVGKTINAVVENVNRWHPPASHGSDSASDSPT